MQLNRVFKAAAREFIDPATRQDANVIQNAKSALRSEQLSSVTNEDRASDALDQLVEQSSCI